MARSAAQKAARRLKRQLRPSFPFLTLPPELQLHILCKCDMASIRRLLGLSSYLKELYLAYPEACLQEVLQQMPRPVSNLLRMSWAIHNVEDHLFEPSRTVSLLERTNITEDWSNAYTNVVHQYDDPIVILEGLVDLHEEVDAIVELYAQSVNAVMETFADPYVVFSEVVLSTEEYTRFACAFWVIRIFYQLQLKFAHHGQANDFVPALMQQLRPWQMEQSLAVECFLQNLGNRDGDSMYAYVDEKHASEGWFSEKSLYVRNYFKVTRDLAVSFSDLGARNNMPLSFSRVARLQPGGLPAGYIRHPPYLPQDQVSHSQTATSLRNHGWIYFESVNKAQYRLQRYLDFFLELGMFFWDLNRLTRWDLADPSEFPTSLLMLHDRLYLRNVDNFCCRMPRMKTLGEKFADRIIKWTRCSVQCSFEEWTYQERALASFTKTEKVQWYPEARPW